MSERLTKSRFASRPLSESRRRIVLGISHDAVRDARTLFPSTVVANTRSIAVIKSGVNSRKIGGEVLKGKWRGFPIFTLTLEERATCPATCALWRGCYGNKMQYAQRMSSGADLEWRLRREVAGLALDHKRGFAVRLHNLGDFYSVEYVQMWRELLDRYEPLHVFGYSARWHLSDPVARELADVVARHWDRFAVRFSNAPGETRNTITIAKPNKRPEDAILCPEQVGKTESCSTCGLCWSTDRRIAFLRH